MGYRLGLGLVILRGWCGVFLLPCWKQAGSGLSCSRTNSCGVACFSSLAGSRAGVEGRGVTAASVSARSFGSRISLLDEQSGSLHNTCQNGRRDDDFSLLPHFSTPDLLSCCGRSIEAVPSPSARSSPPVWAYRHRVSRVRSVLSWSRLRPEQYRGRRQNVGRYSCRESLPLEVPARFRRPVETK